MSEQVDVNVAAATHHVHPIQAYLGVFGALVLLTTITVGVSYMNLGPASLYVALLVAFIKAGLVVGFFMHLRYDSRFHQLIFFSSAIFILILFGFTFLDLTSRSSVIAEQGNFALAEEEAAARAVARLPAPQTAAPARPAAAAPAPPAKPATTTTTPAATPTTPSKPPQ